MQNRKDAIEIVWMGLNWKRWACIAVEVVLILMILAVAIITLLPVKYGASSAARDRGQFGTPLPPPRGR